MPVDISQWSASDFVAIIIPIGGGIAWAVNEHRKGRKEKDESRASIVEREQSYSDRLEERLRREQERNEQLSRELIDARLASADKGTPPVDIVRQIIQSDNGISFAKRRVDDGEWRMIRVSNGFAKTFLGGPPEIYDDKPDSAIFPSHQAELYLETDEKVYKTQQGVSMEEPVYDSPTGVTGLFRGRKYVLRLPDGTDVLIGTGEFYPEGL